MWSGPHNIVSTAMMRAWGSRQDTFVCDQPLYAHYLKKTGKSQPDAEQTIANHQSDWKEVVKWLTGPIPDGRPVFFQMHKAHHLLPEIQLDWLDEVTSCFLIRNPSEMIASLLEFTAEPKIEDTGLPQQCHIFELVRKKIGATPPILDTRDVLENPRGMLEQLCKTVGVLFDADMLQRPSGSPETDGGRSKHWLDEVEETNGAPDPRKTEQVPEQFPQLLAQCNELYGKLHSHRLSNIDVD